MASETYVAARLCLSFSRPPKLDGLTLALPQLLLQGNSSAYVPHTSSMSKKKGAPN